MSNGNLISWLVVFHLIGMVFWIGGLLMATQILRADAAPETGPAVHDANLQLANRSLRAYAHPGAAIMVVTGVAMAVLLQREFHMLMREGWFHAKLLLVVVLIVFDLLLTRKVRNLAVVPAQRQQAGMYHGIISALFLAILVLVILQPHF